MAAGHLMVLCAHHKMWCIRNACLTFTPHKYTNRHVGGLVNGDLGLVLGEIGTAIATHHDKVDAGLDTDVG